MIRLKSLHKVNLDKIIFLVFQKKKKFFFVFIKGNKNIFVVGNDYVNWVKFHQDH
jgi:hypothetical protein